MKKHAFFDHFWPFWRFLLNNFWSLYPIFTKISGDLHLIDVVLCTNFHRQIRTGRFIYSLVKFIPGKNLSLKFCLNWCLNGGFWGRKIDWNGSRQLKMSPEFVIRIFSQFFDTIFAISGGLFCSKPMKKISDRLENFREPSIRDCQAVFQISLPNST